MNMKDIQPKRYETPIDRLTFKHISLSEPKVFRDEITQTYRCLNNVMVQIYEMAETHIFQSIIDYARERGINNLFLIDEEFVKSALMHEKARRERQALKPKTNFDRITESVESLAHFLYVLSDGCGCRCETCPLEETDDCGNKEKIKEWLQKEADDGI